MFYCQLNLHNMYLLLSQVDGLFCVLIVVGFFIFNHFIVFEYKCPGGGGMPDPFSLILIQTELVFTFIHFYLLLLSFTFPFFPCTTFHQKSTTVTMFPFWLFVLFVSSIFLKHPCFVSFPISTLLLFCLRFDWKSINHLSIGKFIRFRHVPVCRTVTESCNLLIANCIRRSLYLLLLFLP